MSKIVTDSKNYSDIADAIRAKGISGTFKPNEMADAIESISGGSTSHISKVEEYTHPEDWVTDTKGNTQNFVNTYFAYQQASIYPFQIAFVENNTASGSYRANIAIYFRAALGNNLAQFGRGDGFGWTTGVGTNISFYISAGAKITVVTLEHDEF